MQETHKAMAEATAEEAAMANREDTDNKEEAMAAEATVVQATAVETTEANNRETEEQVEALMTGLYS